MAGSSPMDFSGSSQGASQNIFSQEKSMQQQPQESLTKEAPMTTTDMDHILHAENISSEQNRSPASIASEMDAERKRPASLFERFTGISRTPRQEAPAPSAESSPASEADVLEIPAFLRRGS